MKEEPTVYMEKVEEGYFIMVKWKTHTLTNMVDTEEEALETANRMAIEIVEIPDKVVVYDGPVSGLEMDKYE